LTTSICGTTVCRIFDVILMQRKWYIE